MKNDTPNNENCILNIENKLQELCMKNSEYAELWSTWNLNKQTLDPILNTIIKDYPHYSFHDSSHSESILLNIERLLGNNINKLSPTDLWLLLHVAYLHDFGMVILDTKIYEIWRSKDFQNFIKEQCNGIEEDVKNAANLIVESGKEKNDYDVTWPLDIKKATTVLLSSYCRNQHAEFSQNYILDTKNVWGIDLGHNGLVKNRLISLISDISVIHTKQFEDILSLHKESNGFKNDYMHPRFVAALLRLGDVLDLDNGRFNSYGDKIFGDLPTSSKRHFEKHEATKHVLINNELIEVEADCQTDDVYRETRKWFDSLKREVENLNLSWNDIAPSEFGRPPKLSMCKITRNGSEDLNELANLRFSISQSKAFEIIEGSSIYKDKFSCLREIIQNAEDASKIQLWRDIKSGIYFCHNGIDEEKVKSGELLPHDIPSWIYKIYSIEVDVSRNESNNAIVTIKDHGTGISTHTLKAICSVGQSYLSKKERKQEIEQMPVWLRPTANFGVGLQSCFMVTDRFSIITKSNNDDSLDITFESGKGNGYVNVNSAMNYNTRGSTVKIEFKNDTDFSYDLFGFTAKNLSSIDPFESNCVVIYKIIESIFNECNRSFFNIHVTSQEINFNDTIKSLFVTDNDGKVLYDYRDGFLYRMIDDSKTCEMWYKNTIYKIGFTKPGHNSLSIRFKGKTVNEPKHINYMKNIGLKISIDIYGRNTKQTLSLNREELKINAALEIYEDLYEAIKLYLDLLYENQQLIKEDFKVLDSYFLSSWIYEKKFPKDLKINLSKDKTICLLKYDSTDKKYKPEKCSLFDLADSYPSLSYLNCEINDNDTFSNYSMTTTQIINFLKKSNIEHNKYKYIITDRVLKKYLEFAYCDFTYLSDNNKELYLYTVNLTDKLYSPDKNTRKQLIKKLTSNVSKRIQSLSDFTMRRAIVAFKDYENIATKLKDLKFIGLEMTSKWYIISPISLTDKEKLDELSKEAFVDYIISKDIFNNIVEHVLENSKIKNNSKKNIVDCYKKLIAEYYETMKTSS